MWSGINCISLIFEVGSVLFDWLFSIAAADGGKK